MPTQSDGATIQMNHCIIVLQLVVVVVVVLYFTWVGGLPMQGYIDRAATPLHGHIKTHLKTIQFFHSMMIIRIYHGKTKDPYSATATSCVVNLQNWLASCHKRAIQISVLSASTTTATLITTLNSKILQKSIIIGHPTK